MATDFGQFSPIVPQAVSLLAVVGALLMAFKKRAAWEPVEEDVPQGPQRVASLVAAVAIGALWWYQGSSDRDVRSDLIVIAIGCAVAVGVSVLVYGVLITVFTFERQVATGAATTSTQKIIGGFTLTPAAAKARKAQALTIQELLKGAAYDPDKVWTRFSRATAKAAFSTAYMALICFGTVALASISIALVPLQEESLASATVKWIEEAEQAKSKGTLNAATPFPVTLLNARTAFESAWRKSSLAERKRVDPKTASKALSYVVGVYRVQEQTEGSKNNSMFWADEAIRFFDEIQNRDLLLEALLDKAAILLDLAQLENTSQEEFTRISAAGDALMTRAAAFAGPLKKAEVFRISSRFYYNLARPKSFRLSDAWDNNYLLLACDRAAKAVDAAPDDIKNANQLLRSTMKAAKNPPQDSDPSWGGRLRKAQQAMKAAWSKASPALANPSARLSPLSVLGTGTLEAVAREWHDLPAVKRTAAASTLAQEMENDSLALLREAEAFLKNGELRKSYGFDIYYDIARAYAQRVVMLRAIDARRASSEFGEVKANFSRARENAKASQLDAAAKDIDRDLSFSKLAAGERAQLRQLLRSP